MGAKRTQVYYNKLQPESKQYDVYDSGDGSVPQLFLRIRPTGRKTWHVYYIHEGKKYIPKIADFAVPLNEARLLATEALVSAARGIDPQEEKRTQRQMQTVKSLINLYEGYVVEHNRAGAADIQILRRMAKGIEGKPITPELKKNIAAWCQKMKADGRSSETIKRNLNTFFAMLAWAAEFKHIEAVPFKRKGLDYKTERAEKYRVLTDTERDSLFKVLRDRRKLGMDYLYVAILIAYHTGIRHKTLCQLKWSDVRKNETTGHAELLLRGETMKGGKTCVIPINKNVVDVINEWRRLTHYTDYLFPSFKNKARNIKETSRPTPPYMTDINGHAWKTLRDTANISKDFTWHCFRHDFATRLVRQGENILIVQRLLCHSKIEMTMVYMHTSTTELEAAVDKL